MNLRNVYTVALASRFIVYAICCLSIIAVWPYDTSAALGSNPVDGLLNEGFTKLGLGLGLDALGRNWDAEYFRVIAKQGYTFEQFHAFWPLVPWLNRLAAALVQKVHFEDGSDLEGLISFIVGNSFFVLSAGEIYR